jgi:hypothetical protein
MRRWWIHPSFDTKPGADRAIELRWPTLARQWPHTQRLWEARECEAFLLAEELQCQRHCVFEHCLRDGNRSWHEREYHLVRDKEIVGDTTDLAGHGYSGGRGLRIAPDPINHWRLQRGRSPELQTQVTRKPRRSDHIDLLPDADAVCRYNQRYPGFSSRRRWRSLEQTSQSRVDGGRRHRSIRLHIDSQGRSLGHLPTLPHASRANLPPAGTHSPQTHFEQRRSSGPA